MTDTSACLRQIWADVDPRMDGRRFEMVEITDTHAVGAILRPDGSHTGRRTRIRLDRLKPGPTGYRLVREAPVERPESEVLRLQRELARYRGAVSAIRAVLRHGDMPERTRTELADVIADLEA